jgi:hypothetical protein
VTYQKGMTMLYITYATEDAALATRQKTDLEKAGYTLSDSLPAGIGNVLIAVLSPGGWSNAAVQENIFRALDNSQHIIPVLSGMTVLPKLIDHLATVDFTNGYPFDILKAEVDRLSSPEAARPMKALTPYVRRANRRVGYWLFALALIWFIVALIVVGVYNIQAPTAEYNSIATFAQATINVYVGRNLPRTTEDAINFPLTIQAAPTAQRPLLIATGTRLAGGKSATEPPTPEGE